MTSKCQYRRHPALDNMKMYARTKNIPVIFITAFPGQEATTRLLELGAVDFIANPSIRRT